MRLKKGFLARGAEEVARDLLGKVIVRKFQNGRIIRATIVETEAYIGEHDLASHARRGRTKRTDVMYGEAGMIYMFFTYGVHWMLNIVTSKKGDPQAVLVRGVRVVNTLPSEEGGVREEDKDISGPGKLTKYLELDESFYNEDITTSKELWVELPTPKASVAKEDVVVTPRIGIDYAKEWRDKPLRFLLRSEIKLKRSRKGK